MLEQFLKFMILRVNSSEVGRNHTQSQSEGVAIGLSRLPRHLVFYNHIQIFKGCHREVRYQRDKNNPWEQDIEDVCSYNVEYKLRLFIINKVIRFKLFNSIMLDFQNLLSSTRKQPQTKHKNTSKTHIVRSPLLSFRQTNASGSHSFSLPKQHKIKQCLPEHLDSFNLCQSKDVFVFAKKMTRPQSTSKSPMRKIWNCQDQLGSNEEVFLPNPNWKGRTYRILSKTSYGKRKHLEEKGSPRSMSTCRTRKLSIRINPEPWQLGVDPVDFDNIF